MLLRRSLSMEVRTAADGKVVQGYAAVFNSRSAEMWGMFEEIAPGAFKRSLGTKDHDIVGLWSHDTSRPLASRDAGTLKLSEDKRGLSFEMDLSAGPSWVADAYEAIRTGTVRKMSIGFSVLGEEWRKESGAAIRTLTDVELFEVSPVVFPAYGDTEAEARELRAAHDKFFAQPGAASQGEKGPDIGLMLAINRMKARSR